jgi:hypothetical protein
MQDNRKRPEKIEVYVAPTEKQTLRMAAAKVEKSMSALLREVAFDTDAMEQIAPEMNIRENTSSTETTAQSGDYGEETSENQPAKTDTTQK